MPPRYPLPVPGRVTVGQTGTAAMWNTQINPGANFLGNRPYGYLIQNTVQSIGSGYNPIAFDGGFDNAGAHSAAVNNTQYFCQLPGVYHVTGQVGIYPTPANPGSYPWADLYFCTNGVSTGTLIGSVRMYFDTNTTYRSGGIVQISTYLTLNAGDYLQLLVTSGVSAGLTTGQGYYSSRMYIQWVSS